jgi:hypothetical protein
MKLISRFTRIASDLEVISPDKVESSIVMWQTDNKDML